MDISELNILVVEDDEFQRRMVVDMLRRLGATSIIGAGNGRQALEVIRTANSAPVHVALCDLDMPEMDGMEFLRHMGHEYQDVAVVITSALDAKLLSSVGRMAGMYGIKLLGSIEKPITQARLKEVLSGHVRQQVKARQPTENSNISLDEILAGIRDHQFEPFFQPKVDLKTGRLAGAEALARWVHPEKGVIGPYTFIPALERSGNIDELTFLILDRSAAQCRTLHDQGHILTVSVNLSLTSLDNPDLADKVTQIVRNAGIGPEYIVLEITESAAMTDGGHAMENLARLCMNGFVLSIDDFGTGYSSLQQLTRIPFGELKIDQSFVAGCAENEALGIVVAASIEMAHKLGVQSVAEGVESQQDWDMLKNAGCDMAQGYLVGKPMATSVFLEFVAGYDHNRTVATPVSSVRNHQQASILVVDDDSFVRKLVRRVLRDLGHKNVEEADGAEAAIKLFEAKEFDLIISDVEMPGINGLQFVQMIRTGRTLANRETRIVMLTSFSQEEVLGSALALDINGFLVKPVIPAVVDQKLAKALAEGLLIRPAIAYEAVQTDLKGLSKVDSRPTGAYRGASITLGAGGPKAADDRLPARRVALQGLRAGMVLKDDIHLTEGTLLLSSGHVLTESSINRLNEIAPMLRDSFVTVREPVSQNRRAPL